MFFPPLFPEYPFGLFYLPSLDCVSSSTLARDPVHIRISALTELQEENLSCSESGCTSFKNRLLLSFVPSAPSMMPDTQEMLIKHPLSRIDSGKGW